MGLGSGGLLPDGCRADGLEARPTQRWRREAGDTGGTPVPLGDGDVGGDGLEARPTGEVVPLGKLVLLGSAGCLVLTC